jgi:hypothetical protein
MSPPRLARIVAGPRVGQHLRERPLLAADGRRVHGTAGVGFIGMRLTCADPAAWSAAARRARGLLEAVVDPVDEDVLERHPPTGGRLVVAAGVEQLGEGVLAVDRHEVVAQRVVGGVQADGERDRQAQLASRRMPGTSPTVDTVIERPTGRTRPGVQPAHGLQRDVEVRQRLAHAHEHDVGDVVGAVGQRRRPGIRPPAAAAA